MNTPLRNMATIYLTRGNQLLLLHRTGSRVVGDAWVGSAGGHFKPEELNAPQRCALRELHEETGLTQDSLEGLALRYITVRRTNGEIRFNYYFFAILKANVHALSSNEGELAWFAAESLPWQRMPCTARHALRHYLAKGRTTDALYFGVASENDMAFLTLEEGPPPAVLPSQA